MVSTLRLFDPVTLTFNLLISNEVDDQNLSWNIPVPSLVMICPVVFVLECTHTYTHTHICTEPLIALITPATTWTWVTTVDLVVAVLGYCKKYRLIWLDWLIDWLTKLLTDWSAEVLLHVIRCVLQLKLARSGEDSVGPGRQQWTHNPQDSLLPGALHWSGGNSRHRRRYLSANAQSVILLRDLLFR